MAARMIVDTIREKDGNITTAYSKTEWMIDSSSDLSGIPKVAPGSVAYTADMTYMAMFDGTEWHELGGGDD